MSTSRHVYGGPQAQERSTGTRTPRGTLHLALLAAAVCLTQTIGPTLVQAQTAAWKARYAGPAGSDIIQTGQVLAVDAAGNSYITGYTGTPSNSDDYATVKYSPNGTQLWVATYNGPGNSGDYPYAITVDTSGNVYVTGGSSGSGTGQDYATIKYNSDGTQLWASRYNQSSSTDEAHSIEVDASGNVYVTGQSHNGSHWDWRTIKYDSNGGSSWNVPYNGPPGNDTDIGNVVKVDGSGNVVVAGYSVGSGTNQDFAVVKYNPGGGQTWVARYNNSPSNSTDIIDRNGMTMDAAGNIYVTGRSQNSASGQDFYTIKYDSGGAAVWSARFNGLGNTTDQPFGGVKVDAAGNVYVAGQAHNGSNQDIAAVKYNSSGTQQWSIRYDGLFGEDYIFDLTVDAEGNLYLAGQTVGLGESENYITLKYDPSGTELWHTSYNGPSFGSDIGKGIALTPDGNLIVTGYDTGAGTGNDFLTIKYFQCNNLSSDCNSNGAYDSCDINAGTSEDCNTNGIPDECDISSAFSVDCDVNAVPDECDNVSGNVTWTGPNGGNYDNPAYWTPALKPRGQATARFANTGASDNRCVISASGTTGVCASTLQASGSGKQILQINFDSTYYASNGMTIMAGGELDLRGGTLDGGPVTNAGNTITGYGQITSNIDNDGMIIGKTGQVLAMTGSSFSNSSSGLVNVQAGGAIVVDATSVSQSGDFEVHSNATLGFGAALTNASGASITLYGGGLAPASLTNDAGGTMTGFGTFDSDVTNDGFMATLADTQIVGDLENNGTILNMTGVLTIIGNTTGSGTIIGQSGRGGNNGFTITGNAILDPAATLIVQQGEFRVGGNFDVAIDDASRFDLAGIMVQVGGVPGESVRTIEALSDDMGRHVALPDRSLFSLNRLRVGPAGTRAQLVDRHRNGASGWSSALYVDSLVLDLGTTLDLAGQRLYYGRVTPADPYASGSGVSVIDSVGGGLLCQIGGTRGDGDLNGDCTLTADDISAFVAVLVGLDAEPAHTLSADVNGDGRANGADVTPFVARVIR